MSLSYLTEAFKKLKILDEEDFNLSDKQDFEKLQDFENDEPEDTIEIMQMDFDDEVPEEEPESETHVGDVIFDCPVCHSKIYKNPDEVVIDDVEQLANVGEECPYCFTTDGFNIVGQVAPYQPEDEVTVDIEDKEEIEDSDKEIEEDDVNESFKRPSKKRIRESREPLDPASIEGIQKILRSVLDKVLGKSPKSLGNISHDNSHPMSATFRVKDDPDYIKSIDEKDYQIRRALSKELDPMKVSLRQVSADDKRGTATFTFDNSDFKPNNLGGKFKESKRIKEARDPYEDGFIKGEYQLFASKKGSEGKFEKIESKIFNNQKDLNRYLSRSAERIGSSYDNFYVLDPEGELTYSTEDVDFEESLSRKSKKIKESKLTEKNWDYTLKSGSLLRDAIDEGDLQQVQYALVDCYDELHDNDLIDDDDYDSYIEELQMLDAQDEDAEDEFDYQLNEFYDLCDNLNVWVAMNESLNENLEKVELETENQRITVKSEPKEEEPGEQMIVPIEPEVKAEIEDNVEVEGEPEEESEVDFDIDDFDEESFDEIGESYLRRVYENVNSFKTSNVSIKNNKLFVEGLIKFKSGKQKKTNFIFEAKDATRTGRLRFMGENYQIARGKKCFTLKGLMNKGRFISESLNYNYKAKNSDGKSTRIYGTSKASKK